RVTRLDCVKFGILRNWVVCVPGPSHGTLFNPQNDGRKGILAPTTYHMTRCKADQKRTFGKREGARRFNFALRGGLPWSPPAIAYKLRDAPSLQEGDNGSAFRRYIRLK